MGHEEQQQVKLAVGQSDRLPADGHRSRRRGHGQIPDRDLQRHRRGGSRGTTQHRAHPQCQFTRAERLGQVVVGTGLQTGDPVVLLVERGQQDHRHGEVAALAQRPAQRQTIGAGHHHVEHRDVDPLGAEYPQRLVAVADNPDLMAVAFEVTAHDIAHDGIIVGDQNT